MQFHIFSDVAFLCWQVFIVLIMLDRNPQTRVRILFTLITIPSKSIIKRVTFFECFIKQPLHIYFRNKKRWNIPPDVQNFEVMLKYDMITNVYQRHFLLNVIFTKLLKDDCFLYEITFSQFLCRFFLVVFFQVTKIKYPTHFCFDILWNENFGNSM